MIAVEEVWKPITHYNRYEISSEGRVRRRLKSGSFKYLVSVDNGNGYMRLNLYKDKRQTKFYIHRLVATMFLRNKKNLPEVHHIDHNRQNNSLHNLKWVTSEENNSYKIIHNRKIFKRNPSCAISNP